MSRLSKRTPLSKRIYNINSIQAIFAFDDDTFTSGFDYPCLFISVYSDAVYSDFGFCLIRFQFTQIQESVYSDAVYSDAVYSGFCIFVYSDSVYSDSEIRLLRFHNSVYSDAVYSGFRISPERARLVCNSQSNMCAP